MHPGDPISDLTVTLHDQSTTTLSALADGQHLAVFFYPKAFTGGCTSQACHFRDLSSEFAAAGINVVGVSRDSADLQAKFRDEHDFGFPLITDQDGSVAKAFGAKRIGPVPSRRMTVTVDPKLRVVHVTSSETDMNVHADEALGAVAGAS